MEGYCMKPLDKANENTVHEKPSPSIALSSIVFLGSAFIIGYSMLVLEMDPHIPIVFACLFVSAIGVIFLKISWQDIEEGMIKSVASALQAILLVMIIGTLIGIWIQCGVVPSLMYYGLSILSPSNFLLAALLICSIVSLCTGSNWSTAATIGVALLGVAHGLGIPAPLTAGFIISGAYLGDKMSPLSDTTNLAPACSGSNIFDHIKAMCWSTVPAYCIVVVIALLFGMKYSSLALDDSLVRGMMEMIKAEFPVGLYAVVPPLIVLVLAILKVPAIPGLFAAVIAGICISLMHGNDLASIITVLTSGYESSLAKSFSLAEMSGIAEMATAHGLTVSHEMLASIGAQVSRLLSRGGLIEMMETVGLMIVALAFGGAIEACGFLDAFLKKLVAKVRNPGDLMTVTGGACVTCNVLMGDSYLAIALPGRMFQKVYKKMGLAPMMLSRATEDFGTLTSVMIPWNSCGAVISSSLSVSTFAYAPYCFLNYINPIVSIIISYLKIGLYWGTTNGYVRARHYPGDSAIKSLDPTYTGRENERMGMVGND